MGLDIVQGCLVKYLGGHVLILDALIGQDSRSQPALQIHFLKTAVIQIRQSLITAP